MNNNQLKILSLYNDPHDDDKAVLRLATKKGTMRTATTRIGKPAIAKPSQTPDAVAQVPVGTTMSSLMGSSPLLMAAAISRAPSMTPSTPIG